MEPEVRPKASGSLDALPDDELRRYVRFLGVIPDASATRSEVLRLAQQREALIESLDRDALIDVVVWLRIPVRASATRRELAGHIVGATKMDFSGLSDRGLAALALLRGVVPTPGEPRASLEQRLRRAEGWWSRVRRVRRSVVASMINRLIQPDQPGGEYHFLPDEQERENIRERIRNVGIVGGLARTLRSAADDYVAEKLDEIEARIDRKLDEIDRRLCEWRDREVANRLRIIRITLISTVVVALLSLGYEYVKRSVTSSSDESSSAPAGSTTAPATSGGEPQSRPLP